MNEWAPQKGDLYRLSKHRERSGCGVRLFWPGRTLAIERRGKLGRMFRE